ncbi:MAG: 8-oxo-dGTP diphosphatase MutT [Chromatiales bacterium]|jgi:8-oxo-dGTP diphosphatase|nr:8-oxo-dGTP diphosphatase MutT [Chromatiales bacterium]
MSSQSSSDKPLLVVAVGVLVNPWGHVLIAQRPVGKHMAGAWEFPGGKVEADESVSEALFRELQEELGIELTSAQPLMAHRHEYPDRIVDLQVLIVRNVESELLQSKGFEGQLLRWVTPERLMESGILEADRPIAEYLIKLLG